MTKNRVGIILISFILIGLIVGGQLVNKRNSKSEDNGNVEVTYTIGYLPITHALPVFEVKELLEKENSKIRIQLQKFSSWSDLTDALHSGKIDGASELIELAMSAKTKGVNLKVVALGHRDGNVIITNDSIKKPEDMKGKTFAIPSTQSSHYILLLEELEKAGLSDKDISITQLAPSEMPSSLASGAIDGYCVAEPFGAQAVTQGFGNVLARSEDLWDDSVCCGLVFREDVISSNKEAFNEFIESYKASGEKLDTDEAIRIAGEYLGQDEKTLKTSLEWISYDNLSISETAYEDLYNKVIKDKMIENPPVYEDFVYTGEEGE